MAPFPAHSSSGRVAHKGLPLPPWPLAGFTAAFAAVIVIAVLSYLSIADREQNVTQVRYSIEVGAKMQDVFSALQDAETGQRGYLLSGEESYLTPYTNARATLAGLLQSARRLITAPRRLQQLDIVEKLATAKMQELADTIELRAGGEQQKAVALLRTDRGKVLMDRIRQVIGQMQEEELRELELAQARTQSTLSRAAWVSIGGSALLLFLIGIAALWTSRDYRALQTRDWLRSGQAGLSARLQGEQSPEALGQNILEFLAAYLDAQVGAVYLVQRNLRFRRVAAYAIEAGNDEVEAEGLIAQAAKQNRASHVREVPSNYLAVSSGVGRSRPAELLIMPASIEGVVFGVLELGFFRAVQPADRALLETTAESVAMAVRSAIDRRRLIDLLEQTQRQSEELQSQQEELRVSNQELEQQGELLRANQAALHNQQAELEATNVQLEEHSQLLARQNQALDTARRELAVKATEVERSSQFKSEFLANMSHELRTPLNSTLILAKLLGDNATGNLSAEQIKFAQTIYAAGNDLLELINEILDLSKIEARQIAIHSESVALARVIDALQQAFAPLADDKGIDFSIHLEPDAPAQIHTDSQRLRQILRNLLSNAIKFTGRGSVSLRVFTPTQAPDWIAFAVTDTGIGIAPEHHDSIFEPFRQADGTTNRKFGGTGLGLSISRQLAAMLGGRIELRSTLGAGSTFTLELPQTAPPAALAVEATRALAARADAPPLSLPRRAAPAATPKRQRSEGLARSERLLLIIEDDARFAQTLCELATGLQYECVVAATADEGIELALEHRPTAIVLDIRLPDHLGLAVLDRLKHDTATRHIPIQVISGYDYSQPALEMGAANVLKKPVERDQLIAALTDLGRRASDSQRTVLVVENNTIERDSVRQLLESTTVRVVAVASAAAALQQLKSISFDCMVLDLALADASGYEVLERMSSDEAYSFPPVIVYTAGKVSAEEEQRLRQFSKSIIIKGARSPERLLDEVTLFLHRVEASLPAEQQRMLSVARRRDTVFSGRRMLLVEDDVRNVFAITRVLEQHGVRLAVARNGREALAALDADPALDLVLMDVMMPEMDGLEATREIRKRSSAAKLPIIALTAKAMPDDRQRCLDAGANDYITKPIDIDKLLSLLRIWLPPRVCD